MSARTRYQPWFRPHFRRLRIRWMQVCADWDHETQSGNRWLWAATRPATVSDVPEERVAAVFGNRP